MAAEVAPALAALSLGPDSHTSSGDQKAALADYSDFQRSGIYSAFLSETVRSLATQKVSWDTYLKASMIDSAELAAIKRFDEAPAARLAELSASDSHAYILLLVSFLQKISRTDTVQYLLYRLDAAVSVVLSAHAKTLCDKPQAASIYPTLAKLTTKDDEFTQYMAAKIIAELFCLWGTMPTELLTEYLTWVGTKLRDNKSPKGIDLAIQCVHAILRNASYRLRVWNSVNVVEGIVDILKKAAPAPQLQYQCILCLWLLSFIPDAAAGLQRMYDIIPVLLDVSRSALKEKVVRVCLATLRNMLDKAPETNMLPMVGNRVFNMCETFATRKWVDDEIKEDLEHLQAELGKSIQSLSTWDEYASELRSGKLVWSPPHSNENFWKQNAQKLNERDYELLRILARLLVTAGNPVCLAVACHDIGQYVKNCPQGKKLIQDLGTKQQIMELMTHENAEVRYQALLAVQAYMANAWGA